MSVRGVSASFLVCFLLSISFSFTNSIAGTAKSTPGDKSALPKKLWIDRFDAKVGVSPYTQGWEGGGMEEGRIDHQYVWQQGNVFLRSRYILKEDAEALKKKVEWDTREYPYLRWRWRVQKFPQGANILEGGKSDAAAQVYLLWKGTPTYYVLKYFWTTSNPVGTLLEQSMLFMGKLRGLVIRSGGKAGVWHTETRNVAQDYRRFFGDDPPGRVRGIAILSDGDQTNTPSEADYDDLQILRTLDGAGK